MFFWGRKGEYLFKICQYIRRREMDFLIAERLSPMNRCQPRVENDCATKEGFLSSGNLFIKGCCLNCLRILFEKYIQIYFENTKLFIVFLEKYFSQFDQFFVFHPIWTPQGDRIPVDASLNSSSFCTSTVCFIG